MEVADDPIWGIQRGVKVIKDPVQVPLKGATQLKEVTLCNVAIRASCGLAVGDAFERETIQFLLRLQEVGVNGVLGFRCRQKLPAKCSGKQHLHAWIQRVWRLWERGLIKEVKSVGLVPRAAIINVGGRPMPNREPRGKPESVERVQWCPEKLSEARSAQRTAKEVRGAEGEA